jgi:hypothetical protein
MENNTTQTTKILDGNSKGTVKSNITLQKPSATIPLIITIIGIFCYLGVILPSVFEANAKLINYSTFDLLLMVGGAALVGLGSYLWFKVKNKSSLEDESKIIELA